MGHSVTQYAGVSAMLGIGILALWLFSLGHRLKDLSARAILSISGYLRTRPDPWLEATLRAAFAEFDRELALILRDRPRSVPARAARAARAEGASHPDFPRG